MKFKFYLQQNKNILMLKVNGKKLKIKSQINQLTNAGKNSRRIRKNLISIKILFNYQLKQVKDLEL